ncbi:MAG: hypothetical protein LBH29_07730 [Elusimicrobiota bacterium]|nr:hypothetical protein [Elusimicrobiota bacterium]
MKKILLCLCFVFAVGLLFSACGKDDKTNPPASTTSAEANIDGKNVKLYVEATGAGKNIKWKVAGNEILIKASALANGGNPELDTVEYLEIDAAKYEIAINGVALQAWKDGRDETSDIGLTGQYTSDDHTSDPVQVGDYESRIFKITKLLTKDCNLTISFTIKVVENF